MNCDAGFGGEGEHFGIAAQAGDIVEDVRTRCQSGPGDGGFRGVDGNENLGRAAEGLDHGENSPDFLLGGNSLTAGAG